LKKITTILFFLVCGFKARATHIMGGDLTYRYISEDSFEFTLAFYIDCVNGNPGAIASDKFAIIGFFNASTKQFIDKVEIERGKPDRVSKLNYACVTPPPNACVDRYEYVFRKRVQIGNDGVIVAFQRCCRNHTITNLVDPGGTGITLLATIPPRQLVAINSNPVFKDSPPNFLCNDAPLIFDHSAIDENGDSLVYDLYLPFKGASSSVPRPSQPSNPDYAVVQYTSAYSLSNLMGGTEKLKIDRKTGQLTVLPNKVGQYVVGIRVSEYRNGIRIGETLRDYQFNVLECDIKISANFDLPEIKCSDSVVAITNTSRFGKTYDWTVSKQSTVYKQSTDEHPVLTFQDHGLFTIKLVARNDQCADSLEKDIEIGEVVQLTADFDIELDDSCDGGAIRIVNNSSATPDWYWNLGMGAGEQRNLVLNQYNVTTPGKYTITLRVSDTAKCALDQQHSVAFEILGRDTVYSDFDFTFPNACNPGELRLLKTDNLSEDWFWSIEGVQDSFFNETQVDLSDLYKGRLNVSLKHKKSEQPCTIIEPKHIDIEIDSLDLSEGKLILYNVFTPNDDGINDCFHLDMQNGACYTVSLVIYNLWGELLFKTENAIEDCWDGKQANGELYPTGTYYGVASVKHQETEESENISISITFIH
jgi:gliding motility-associated-like protein